MFFLLVYKACLPGLYTKLLLKFNQLLFRKINEFCMHMNDQSSDPSSAPLEVTQLGQIITSPAVECPLFISPVLFARPTLGLSPNTSWSIAVQEWVGQGHSLYWTPCWRRWKKMESSTSTIVSLTSGSRESFLYRLGSVRIAVHVYSLYEIGMIDYY